MYNVKKNDKVKGMTLYFLPPLKGVESYSATRHFSRVCCADCQKYNALSDSTWAIYCLDYKAFKLHVAAGQTVPYYLTSAHMFCSDKDVVCSDSTLLQ